MRHKHSKQAAQIEKPAQGEKPITKQNGGGADATQAKIISFTPNKKSLSKH